jgi:aryl-alcohol dehydrogenase-like predicted oxidoreductase
MNYRYLGRSGLKVSELSFGSWVTFGNQVDVDVADGCMAAVYDAGVNSSIMPKSMKAAKRRRS